MGGGAVKVSGSAGSAKARRDAAKELVTCDALIATIARWPKAPNGYTGAGASTQLKPPTPLPLIRVMGRQQFWLASPCRRSRLPVLRGIDSGAGAESDAGIP